MPLVNSSWTASLWYYDLIKQEAEVFGMTVLHQESETSVNDLCDEILMKHAQ